MVQSRFVKFQDLRQKKNKKKTFVTPADLIFTKLQTIVTNYTKAELQKCDP